ncbi:unnamed protein product [Rhizoctonia solani]|uniref:Uncharacterized protein n=1 Tax=Rhizoctonia solani TaxID=456999 RepID=A0A8H2XZ20_9AGAM|nr:unnamed protein product [Rhizoctonia solani]
MLNDRFVAIADRALQAVASVDSKMDKKQWDEKLQTKLDEAILELAGYWDKLSGFGKDDPMMQMIEAREKDEERKSKIISVGELKKIPKFKNDVKCYIHEGSGEHISVPLNISKQSTAEEVLFKLARNPDARIKLHESAFFYTRLTWRGKDSEIKATHLELVSGASAYRAKKGFSDFKEYFNSTGPEPGPVHVFVDRNPSIHILLTTRNWSRLFSLARVIENETVVVLKGVDGTLYHARHVFEKLIQPTTNMECMVFRLDQQNMKTRTNVGLKATECINILCEARNFIRVEDKRKSPSKWLIEIPSASLTTEPSFDSLASKPKMHYKPGLPRPLPLGSSTSVGSVAASSMRTTSQGSGTGGGSDATRRVKEMVERLENERKEAEKKEKEKKGFLSRMFGGKK